MSNVSIKLLDDKAIVTFRGQLNINHISNIQKELEELITFENELDVVIESPESIDITFVQMIVSMRNSCATRGSKFSVHGEFSDDLTSLLKNVGLYDFLNN